jgi:hypothetical protein
MVVSPGRGTELEGARFRRFALDRGRQRGAVAGEQLEPVAGARDGDVELLAVDQLGRVLDVDGGDDGVDGAALGGVGGDGVAVVDGEGTAAGV